MSRRRSVRVLKGIDCGHGEQRVGSVVGRTISFAVVDSLKAHRAPRRGCAIWPERETSCILTHRASAPPADRLDLMPRCAFSPTTVAVATLVSLCVAAASSSAIAQRGAPPRPTLPRTATGKPDLSGIWQSMTSANYDIEAHNARPAMAMRPGPVIPVPAKEVVALGAVGSVPSGAGIVVGGEIPYRPEALAKKRENQEHWLERDPEIRCYLPGVPRANYLPFPFQIVQSERAFFIAYEYAGAVRNVYLKDPGAPQTDSWMGQSVGHWEGDTFVVDVTGFNDRSWLDRSGNHHTENMKVVERYTMTGADHIRYEATIEDPATFTRPWSIRLMLYRNVDSDARLGQFKCVEFVEELLYGHLRKSPLKP